MVIVSFLHSQPKSMTRPLFLTLWLVLTACSSVPVSPHPYKLAYAFNTLDLDHDGGISYEEWYHGVYLERMWFYGKCDYGLDRKIYLSDARTCGMSDDAFVYYDQNKNGFIEVDEFKNLQPKAFFAFADRNQDGTLSASEYSRVAITISPVP